MNWKSVLKMVGSASAGAAGQIITTGLQSGASPTTGAFWSGVGINTGLVALLTLLAHLAPSPVATKPAVPEQPQAE
jgi:hypothetical protein